MRTLVFGLLTITGVIAGLLVGAQEDNRYMRDDAMAQKAIAGGICGMIAGGIACWITASPSKKD
jgi:hypothetical protein